MHSFYSHFQMCSLRSNAQKMFDDVASILSTRYRFVKTFRDIEKSLD